MRRILFCKGVVFSEGETDKRTVTDEIVVIAVLADGGRPRPRATKSRAVPPQSQFDQKEFT